MATGLDPRYIVTSDLESYFVDKDTGLPLAGGIVTFYADNNHTVKKPVYQITGTAGAYTYAALPNPSQLSGTGTFQDALGNNIVPYYLPFDDNGNPQLYYITVQNSGGVLQFTRSGWPNFDATSNSANDDFNFIPNGQFLLHNDGDVPVTTIAGVEYRDIAQGGWTLATTTGTYATEYDNSFGQITTYVPDLSDYPRYQFRFKRDANTINAPVRDLMIRWNDTFTFATQGLIPNQEYTFIFAAQSNTASSYVFQLRLINYYGTGGSPSPTTDVPLTTSQIITPTYNYFIISGIIFPDNTGTVGTNNDDFVAISLRGPDSTFDVNITDVSLLFGNVTPEFFPLSTTAQQMSQSTAGWLPIPAPDNASLYLPIKLGAAGFIYDNSEIGTIVAKLNTTPVNNELLCDGSHYAGASYSAIGVPYARLRDYLISSSPLVTVGLPLFGTGVNYANGYAYAGSTTIFRLTNNKVGAGTVAATGTVAGWTFTETRTGTATINYAAYNNGGNAVLAVGQGFKFPLGNVDAAAGTSGFTIGIVFNINNAATYNGLTTFQNYTFTIATTSGAALANPGGAGKHFTFSNSATDYFMWFHFTDETQPVVAGTPIRVNMPSTALTAADVASIIIDAMNAYQTSSITVGAVPTTGQYFNFFTNPTTPETYYVWYNVNSGGGEPAVLGTGIEVALTNSETTATVLTKTLIAINKHQFAVPDLRGMFLRGLDPNSTWDTNTAERWSKIPGIYGANTGTFEYQQFLSHDHKYTISNITGVVQAGIGRSVFEATADTVTSLTGGTETRPVNTSVNWFIKY